MIGYWGVCWRGVDRVNRGHWFGGWKGLWACKGREELAVTGLVTILTGLLFVAAHRIVSHHITSTDRHEKLQEIFGNILFASFSLYISHSHFSFVAKIQILQKINQVNSLRRHHPRPRHLPHYHFYPPSPFKRLSRRTPRITEAIILFPCNHLHSLRAHPFNLLPPKTVDLPSTERLLHRPLSSSAQTTPTSHHETVLAMALQSACLSGSNLEGPLLPLERVL
jgi:hypothetical protein